MIIDIWGIKTLRNKGIREQKYCFLANREEVINKKKKGYKVRYYCDNEKCKYPNKINITTTGSLYNGNWNSIKKQMCRSCRGIKSEDEIKKSYIEYNIIKEEIESEEYILLTEESKYKEARYRSQFRLKIICRNGHIYYTIWNNWKHQDKRCRKCYEENKRNEAVKYRKGYNLYEFNIRSLTEKIYKKYKETIDPNNLRGPDYSLDHKYSISQGFKDKIPIEIIASPINLEIITKSQNSIKNGGCSITKEELMNEYIRKY